MSFKQFLLDLNVQPNSHWRGDCYVCGGNNTLSVSNDGGSLVYHCFKSSCDCRGHLDIGLSIDYITNVFVCPAKAPPRRSFDMPEHFVEVNGRSEIIEYLIKNNCIDAFEDRRADIKYDPKMNRVVFMCKKGEEYVGATGRALERSVVPKWYIYGNGGCSFFVGGSKGTKSSSDLSRQRVGLRRSVLVLVEDCASACSVSSCMDSIALLGTNLANVDIGLLSTYERVLIALDKDASAKALKLQRDLSFLIDDARVVLLERDLKYCTKEEIKKVFQHEYDYDTRKICG